MLSSQKNIQLFGGKSQTSLCGLKILKSVISCHCLLHYFGPWLQIKRHSVAVASELSQTAMLLGKSFTQCEKPQTVLLSALSHVKRQYFNQCRLLRGGCGSGSSQSITKMLEGQAARIPQSTREYCCSSHPSSHSRLVHAYQSARTVLLWEVWEERTRHWECSYVVASLCCNSQRSHLTPPMGFHFKSRAFVQKCICSLILFGNCVKQKRTNGKKNHSLSLSPPTPSHDHLSPSLSLRLSPTLVVHILLQMLMISPLCILMQGLSTLFPFIHIQMCSYCLFALGPFKMPFWNMPFDKHIIGQVPAVIRVPFNVSKLESEWGAPGPAAICSPLPSPLDISQAAGESPAPGRTTQSPA